MADKNIEKAKRARRRRLRVRKTISGTAARPRLTVAKSLKNVFVQIVDDEKGITLAAAATNLKSVRESLKDSATKMEAAMQVGLTLAATAKEKGIESVVFDRNCNRFQGRVKAVAEGALKGGLKF